MKPRTDIENAAIKKIRKFRIYGALWKAPIPRKSPNTGNIHAGISQYAIAVIVHAVQCDAEDRPNTCNPSRNFRSFSLIIKLNIVENTVKEGTKKYKLPKTALASNPS